MIVRSLSNRPSVSPHPTAIYPHRHKRTPTLQSIGEYPSTDVDPEAENVECKAEEADPEVEAVGREQRTFIKRLSIASFQQFRKAEAEQGRVGVLAPGSWSKMAVVRISRNESRARYQTVPFTANLATNEFCHAPTWE